MKRILILLIAVLFSLNAFAASSKVLMLRDNGPLRKANDSNGVEWAAAVRAGTELELESSEIVIKDLVTSSKTYSDVKFYKVKYNSKTYFVQESDVEICDSASVLQKNTLLFSKPTLYSFRNAILETGTFVVKGETVKQFNNDFTKITFYDTKDSVKRSRYVFSNAVSSFDKDVKAVLLLEKGKATDNEDLRKEFLDNAKAMETSELIGSYIFSEISKIYNVSQDSDDSFVAEDIDSYTTNVTTDDGSKVNVRSLPGTAGEVTGQFESVNRPLVRVSMKTKETQEIDGVTSSWYYVTEMDEDTMDVVEGGIEGWVFGGFLE